MEKLAVTTNSNRDRQARNTLLLALAVGFFGALLGVVFGVFPGTVTGFEATIIFTCVFVTGVLFILLMLRPMTTNGAVSGILSLYFVFHLNAGASIAYNAVGEVIRIIPYVVWFFPLVVFHRFTNMNFHRWFIDLVVIIGPLPTGFYVASRLYENYVLTEVDALVTFLVGYYVFVLFMIVYSRHREAEILRAAVAEETERKAAAAHVSEERFRLLSKATNDLIFDVDFVLGVIWWNDALLTVYGYNPKPSSTDLEAWEHWIHPDDRQRVTGSLVSAMASKDDNWTCEFRFLSADGKALDVVARGLFLRDHGGEPVRMIGSTTDVTELHNLERRLLQSQKLEAIGQLTGGIAHDFNNLLTVVLGNAEVLADMLSHDPVAQRLAETTMQAAERGATLTSRLLAFARRQALDPKIIDPALLLRGIERLIRRTIDEDIDIRIWTPKDLWPIEVDPNQLENAILNLVINARDAMPNGGRLCIEAENEIIDEQLASGPVERKVVITVSDNGVGMSKETIDRAFEPFFTTKDAGAGSGLGLAMVWGFVMQSNGDAKIVSEPGVGTTVKLIFQAEIDFKREVEEEANPIVVGGADRILVVEDDEMVRRFVVLSIRALGYHVQEAASSVEALAVLDEGEVFDLLFTDVVMPGGMNGKQLADEAKALQPNLKILFTSGYTEDAIVHQGRLDTGVALIGKPYRHRELAEKLRQVLDT